MTGARPIFVVDDDDGIRRSLRFLLGVAGFRVLDFANGLDFLAAAGTAPGACVIMDLSMPGRDGLQVLEDLRAGGHRHPVVFLTGHGSPELMQALDKPGVVAILSKPCAAEDLMAAIDRAGA